MSVNVLMVRAEKYLVPVCALFSHSAISYSSLSHGFLSPWDFFRQEYGSRLPFSTSEDLP